jgi:hypothetical protein
VRLDQAVAWPIGGTAGFLRLKFRNYAPRELEMLDVDASP